MLSLPRCIRTSSGYKKRFTYGVDDVLERGLHVTLIINHVTHVVPADVSRSLVRELGKRFIVNFGQNAKYRDVIRRHLGLTPNSGLHRCKPQRVFRLNTIL